MVEDTRQPKTAASLQAGPVEVDQNTLYAINMRVTQRIGRQLAQIGDELDNRWREQLSLQRQHLNMGIYTYVWTRRAFSGILGNIWGSKIKPMLKTSWLIPQLHSGCQEARKWTAQWVSNLHISDWSRKTSLMLASAFLLVTVSMFLAAWN
ncbi:bcl-2-interacting killer [Triplophysa dalaica]|uniref:bcl-2-interacting killer n=1 Tax=Triplophysa dalaica TaxID=1582913 RepID=UPI0024E00391|nr:bcl-2-interacting killer [Triplophysa dalaica]